MAILPMNKDLRKALAAYLEVRNSNNEEAFFLSKRGTRLTDRGIQFQFRNYFDQISLPDKTIHSLRHSFTKNLLDAGTELTVVAELSSMKALKLREHILRQAKKIYAMQ